MSIETQLCKLASQLLGDLDAVYEGERYDRHTADQQRLSLIIEAFERVSELTVDATVPRDPACTPMTLDQLDASQER